MLQSKFQASKQSNYEEDNFLIFSMYFYGLNLGPPGAGPYILYMGMAAMLVM